jgi:uncharacterized protein (DUF58 family)
MRLTRRGKQLLLGSCLGALAAAVLALTALAVVSFSLCLSVLLSGILLRRSLGMRGGEALASPSRVRRFKFDEARVEVMLPWLRSPWVSVSWMAAEAGALKVEAERCEGGEVRLRLSSSLAGVHRGLRLEVEALDVLGAFGERVELELREFVFEALPLSLREEAAGMPPGSGLGERPSPRPGFAQEFYGVEEASGPISLRQVHWKRTAREEDKLYYVRRHADLPERIRVAVVAEGLEGPERMHFIDRACELLGLLGKQALAWGVGMSLALLEGGGGKELSARTPEELADALMALWQREHLGREVGARSGWDILLAGSWHAARDARGRRLTIVMGELAPGPAPKGVVGYPAGKEEALSLLRGVILR